jgi:hypothetical protein
MVEASHRERAIWHRLARTLGQDGEGEATLLVSPSIATANQIRHRLTRTFDQSACLQPILRFADLQLPLQCSGRIVFTYVTTNALVSFPCFGSRADPAYPYSVPCPYSETAESVIVAGF